MKINRYPAFYLYNGGLEVEIDLLDSLRLFHVVGNCLGGQKLKNKIGGLPSAWWVGSPVAPPGSAWRPNKLFLLVGRPWQGMYVFDDFNKQKFMTFIDKPEIQRLSRPCQIFF
jgi:hypothetical protein